MAQTSSGAPLAYTALPESGVPLAAQPRTSESAPKVSRELMRFESEELDATKPESHKNFTQAEQFAKHVSSIMLCVIIANALQMGFENQWSVQDHPELKSVYFGADVTFAALYVFEVLFNLALQQSAFFKKGWNIIDVVLTVLAVYNVYCDMYPPTVSLKSTSFLRLIRFVRIIRLIRVMHTVPDLVMVVEGLIMALKSLGWVLVLMLGTIYIFALFFTTQIGSDPDFDFDGVNYFGDMGHSLLTLIDLAFLTEWGVVVRAVMEHQPALILVFLVFVLVTTFGMLNVMIGVIVDSTGEAKKVLDGENKMDQLSRAYKMWKGHAQAHGIDIHELGNPENHHHLTEVMQRLIEDTETISFPHGLTAEDVISLLDFDASGSLTPEEFVDGLQRLLLGDSFQLTCLMLTVMGKMRKERLVAQNRVDKRLDDMSEQLGEIMRRLDTGKPSSVSTSN